MDRIIDRHPIGRRNRSARSVLCTTLALVAGALLLLPGCNGGTAAVILALALDDDSSSGGRGSGEEFRVEFVGLENGRSRPSESEIVVRLFNDNNAAANLLIEFTELAGNGDGAFRPVTLVSPLVGNRAGDGELTDVPTSAVGRLTRIGWDAVADLGDDSMRSVRLRIGGSIDPPFLVDVSVGNDAPAIEDVQTQQRSGELVQLVLRLADSNGDRVDLEIDYAFRVPGEDIVIFRPATIVGRTLDLPADPGGSSSGFEWDAVRDLGPIDRDALLRIVPTDRVDGGPGKTGEAITVSLSLDNNLPPAVEVLEEEFLVSPDQRGSLALPLLVEDKESQPVDVIVQWALVGEAFPQLDPSLNLTDVAVRETLLRDPAARSALHLISWEDDFLDGEVEAGNGETPLTDREVFATWLSSSEALRGLSHRAGGDRLAGRTLTLIPATGDEQTRRVCGYDASRGILTVDVAFDPGVAAGDRIRLQLGGDTAGLRLLSSPEGEVHYLKWNAVADLPGGGSVRFRVAPFDRVVEVVENPCNPAPFAEDESAVPSEPGFGFVSLGAKTLRGPFLADTPQLVPLVPVDAPVSLVRTDIDSDGRLDMVFASAASDAVVILRQTSRGGFDATRLIDVDLGAPTSVGAGDLDGDGDTDIVATASASGTLLLVFQENGGDFISNRVGLRAGGTLKRPVFVDVADVNGDGRMDLVVADADPDEPRLRVFLRGEVAGYTIIVAPPLPAGNLPEVVSAVDINGDDVPDLVAAGVGFVATYVQNDTPEMFDGPQVLDVPDSHLRALSVMDFDGNAGVDILAADRAAGLLRVATQEPDGTFLLAEPLADDLLTRPTDLAVGDFDDNGVMDLVIADEGEATAGIAGQTVVLMRDASGGFFHDSLVRTVSEGAALPSAAAVTVGDFNADGSLEIATGDQALREVALYSLGLPGSLTDAVIAAEGQSVPSPAALCVADLDGDGLPDVVTANQFNNDLTLFQQGPAGLFSSRRVAIPLVLGARAPVAVAAADLDGDGLGDLVVGNVTSDDLSVLFQESDGSFGIRSTRLAAEGFIAPSSVALADIDGDGRVDVVAGSEFVDQARWFRNGGEGEFVDGGALTGDAVAAPISVCADDMNGDGLTDVVVTTRVENLAIFFQTRADDSVQFAEPVSVNLPATASPLELVTADVDNDGRVDILSSSLGETALYYSRQLDGGDFNTIALSPGSAADPTSLAAGDINSDGRLDVVLGAVGPAGSSLEVVVQGDEVDFSDAHRRFLESPSMLVPVGLSVEDLDGDGEADIISANRLSANVTVFYGRR